MKKSILWLFVFVLFFPTILNAVEVNPIGPGAFSPGDSDYTANFNSNGQRLVRDVNGVLHAVYYQTAPPNTNIIYSRSEDNGLSWTSQTVVTTVTAQFVPFNPCIAFLNVAAGLNVPVFIVYSVFNVDGTDANRTRTYIVNGTSAPPVGTTVLGATTQISNQLIGYTIPSSAGGATAYDNYLYVDNIGLLHLAWVVNTGTDDRVFHAVTNVATNWAVTPTQFNANGINNDLNSDRHPRLTQDPANNLQMVWMGQAAAGAPNYPDGGVIAMASRTPGLGGAWGAVTTYTTGNDMKYPDIIYDTAGNRHLVWVDRAGGNETITYRMNAGANIAVSPPDTAFKAPMVGMTGNDLPAVLYFNAGTLGNPATYTFLSSSKMSPTVWRTPNLLQSPTDRSYGFLSPYVTNDILSMMWFQTSAPFQTIYAQDTDQIPPYQPVTPTALVLTAGTCTADAFASMAATPPGATLVDFRLLKIAGSGPAYDVSSGFQAGLSFTFTNAPVGATYELTVRARDAAGNTSVYSPSANLVIPAGAGTCVTFQVTRPPLVPTAGPTCGIHNFVAIDWTDNDPFDNLPTDAQNSFYIDNDNIDTNGVFQIGVGNNQPIAVASRLAGPISEDDETDSTILNITGAPDNPYFAYGQMIGTVAGTVTSHSSVVFTKNSALNEIPQIVVTNPNAAAMAPVAGIFNIQYNYTSVAVASTVAIYYDPDNNPNNANHTLIQGGIVVGPTPGINPGVAIPWNTSTIQSGTYYIRAEISNNAAPTCMTIDYSGGTVQFNNPITNSFGQRIYNFPNPFSPMTANPYQSTTNIVIRLDSPSDVNLYIFNTHGQMIYRQDITGVTTNFPNFVWNGRDSRGSIVPNGVYIMKALVRNTREVYSGRMSVLDK